jgi:Fe-S cluster biogenesis protein NfuA/nitrite reductase/ring-hydroxylating ferredoxin subunit
MRPRDELEEAGERIEAALGELAGIQDPRLRERAMGALRLVVQLYGDALERVLDIVGERAPEALAHLTADDLVASLLVVHDLHPEPVRLRVQRALDEVRPYLGSHGGDVDLLGVEEGVVRLQLKGSCDGCPSSSVTLELAVEDAIAKAAPEVTDIEVVQASSAADGHRSLISPESLLQPPPGFFEDRRPDAPAPGGAPAWRQLTRQTLPGVAGLAGTEVEGLEVLLARTAAGLYAYRDACPACGCSLRDGRLEGSAVTCPGCGTTFDVEAAGTSPQDASLHLDPLPLLQREGRVELAVPTGAGR